MDYSFDMSRLRPKLREILEDMDSRIKQCEGGAGGAQADAVTPVSALDASTAIAAEYAQAEVQAIATLANANKAAINTMITNLTAAGLMKGE